MSPRGVAWAGLAGAWAGLALAGCLLHRQATGEAAYWRGQADAAHARVGAACAPVYGLWWVERACPGVAGWLLPAGAQALACPARLRAYRAGSVEEVQARAASLPPGGGSPAPLALEERGLRERELRLEWRAEVRR